MVREIRSLQVTGGNTFIVSLPKGWVDALNLKPRDKVAIIEREDNSLAIYPLKLLDKKSKKSITFKYSELGEENTLIRECIGSYLSGYNIIKLIFDKGSIAKKNQIKNVLRNKLIGIEVIEEGIDNMTIQVFAETKEADLMKTLNRIFSVVYLMLENAIEGIKNNKEILEEVTNLDDEVDRFYHFITRQINLALEDPYLMIDLGVSKKALLIEYRLFAKTLERIADHVCTISKNYLESKLEPRKELMQDVYQVADLIKKLFWKASNSFINSNAKLARETALEIEKFIFQIEILLDKTMKKRLDSNIKILFRVMIESFKRISEYSMDICEMTINTEKINK